MHRQKVVAPSLIKISLLLHGLFMFFSKGFMVGFFFPPFHQKIKV